MTWLSQRQYERALMKNKTILLSEFCAVKEGKLILEMRSDNDLFERSYAPGKLPRLSSTVQQFLDSILMQNAAVLKQIEIIPPEDSEYQSHDIFTIVQENLKLRLAELLETDRVKKRNCILLLVGGGILFSTGYFIQSLFATSLFFDIISNLGALLVWTAGDIYFLQLSQSRKLRKRYCQILMPTAEGHHLPTGVD